MADMFFDSVLSPQDVLARLDARAGQWRESALPAVLRREGIHGVIIKCQGMKFRIQSRGGRRRPYVPVLVGRIEPSAAGGSRIEARFWPSRQTLALGIVIFVWFSFLSVSGGGLSFFALGLILNGVMMLIGLAIARREQEGLTAILAEVSDPNSPFLPTPTSSTRTAV
jgi:hypothetical protein